MCYKTIAFFRAGSPNILVGGTQTITQQFEGRTYYIIRPNQ